MTKLVGNDAVKSFISRHEPEILEQFELVVNTVSMEEAVQQQQELAGEIEDDLQTSVDDSAEDSGNGISEGPVTPDMN